MIILFEKQQGRWASHVFAFMTFRFFGVSEAG